MLEISVTATTNLRDDKQRANEASQSILTRPISRRECLAPSVNVSCTAGTTAKSRSALEEMKGIREMAAVEKYTSYELIDMDVFGHNTREKTFHNNREIDCERTHLNYHLDKNGETKEDALNAYYSRLSEVSLYNRNDINTACQWVCTAPQDLSPDQEEAFFHETYNYLNSLYGEENCIQAIVHRDEGVKDREGNVVIGQPHLHYVFIPVVDNPRFDAAEKEIYLTKVEEYKRHKAECEKEHTVFDGREPERKVCTYEEKVCADQVIRRRTLKEFHPAYQRWLDEKGIKASVSTGVTAGKNRTVLELKADTKGQMLDQERAYTKELEQKLEQATTRINELSRELEQVNEKRLDLERDGWGHYRSLEEILR